MKKIRKVGIYCLTNKISNKKYVGQSSDLDVRKRNHFSGWSGDLPVLKRAIKKYGIENFEFDILRFCTVDELNDLEIFYIKELHSHVTEWGYNISWGGSGVMRGRNHSEESKLIMRKKKLGKKQSREHILKSAKGRIGINAGEDCKLSKLTNENVKNIVAMIKDGVPCSEIARLFNVNSDAIREIRRGNSWKNIVAPEDLVEMQKLSREKLSLDDVIEIKYLLADGKMVSEIAQFYSVGIGCISHIKNGVTWSDVIINKEISRGNRDKLSVDEVREIRSILNNSDLTYKEIAEIYGVSHYTIGVIKRNEIWKEVQIGETDPNFTSSN